VCEIVSGKIESECMRVHVRETILRHDEGVKSTIHQTI
jgi:hypothetical protein